MIIRAGERGFTFDYLHDPEQTLAHALGSERTPEVFVFDRDRRLVYHGAIDDNRDDTEVAHHYLRDALDATLAGSIPRSKRRPPWAVPSSGFPDRVAREDRPRAVSPGAPDRIQPLVSSRRHRSAPRPTGTTTGRGGSTG